MIVSSRPAIETAFTETYSFCMRFAILYMILIRLNLTQTNLHSDMSNWLQNA